MIGHIKQKKYFSNLINNGSISHAYLFSGPEMIGKRTFAFELANTIIGEGFEKNPDFKFISPKTEEGESKIYIEDVRDFKKFMSLKSYGTGRRIVVFNDAHLMTSEASNALLKILEEPPVGSFIILVSSMPDMIPATILSRCEEVRFNVLDKKEIDDYLSEKRIKKEDKDFLTVLSGGKIGLVIDLIQKDMISDARKSVDDLRKLFNAGIYEKMDYAKKINEKGDYQPRIDYWLNWVSAHVSSSPKNEKIVKNLLSLHQIISQPQYNHRLALENFLLNL